MEQHFIKPEDVREAAHVARSILEPAVDRDWSKNASGLTWSCQFTLDHIIVGLAAYAGDLAVRSVKEHPVLRAGNPEQPVPELLRLLSVGGGVLADVCANTPDQVRAFHPFGYADWSGFAAMGCVETLVHTDDICWAMQLELQVEEDLSRRLLQRLFPWAPLDGNPWQTLRWATGRGYLEGYDPVGPDWRWHCKPLSEWDPDTSQR